MNKLIFALFLVLASGCSSTPRDFSQSSSMALCEAVFNDTRINAISRLDLKMDELGKRDEDCSRFSHLKKERVELDVDVD